MDTSSSEVDYSKLIGSNLSVTIDAGLYKGEYPSRLEDIVDGAWKLAHPFLGSGLLPIYKKLEVKLSLNNGGNLYLLRGSVSGSIREGRIPYLIVLPVGEVEKIQRRRFVRVPCLLEGMICPLDIENLNHSFVRWSSGVIKDISLGGVKFSIKKDYMSQFKDIDRALLGVVLDKIRYFLCCKVAVLREVHQDDFVDLGLSFESLPGTVEKAFIGFVRQQELASRSERS